MGSVMQLKMSRVVRKPDFCICENKDADQLRGNREADQRLCFRHTDSTIPLLPKSKISSIYPSSVIVSDLVGNPEDRFSHNEAQIRLQLHGSIQLDGSNCFCISKLYKFVKTTVNLSNWTGGHNRNSLI